MAIDSKEKRQAIFSVGKVWHRNVFPVATPDEQWRLALCGDYGGNALSPAAGGTTLHQTTHYQHFNRLNGAMRS